MSTTQQSDISTLWRQFLIDVAFAREYNIGYFGTQLRVKNPVVERLLPSLLHVKAAAILDHALQTFCDDRGLSIPRRQPYGDTLHGRINYLGDNGHLTASAVLHTVRGSRNAIAHDPTDTIDWTKLDNDIQIIHHALVELTFVDRMPDFTVRAERSAAGEGRVPDAICTVDYSIGVFEGERIVVQLQVAQNTCYRMMSYL